MTTDRDVDTSRTAVKTYVPAYQKRRWADHADELGMSQSEFVRTMVQAGRSGFSPSEDAEITREEAPSGRKSDDVPDSSDRPSEEPTSTDVTPGVETGKTGSSEPRGGGTPGLTNRVLEVLDREGVLSWDDLLDAVTDDIEGQLDEAIQELQSENRVRYSGREGGYTLADRS
ncbi:hypothetical protein SAMN06269185_0611 [Natronoarchaeum philippinense]|uniref:Uncharacterized protein n=1 Tax=Natronoarchaeum philippinense TaxID=558529 RepID=A0A285N9F9_NATPI|nr:DUF5805 domain-containing protein [Natronoarchaeum philippinense]SNZ04586.1 hypothetical protein SAMN06269185_0611 [Natronoarchaeum philippinense]